MNALDPRTGDPRDTSMGYLMNDETACNLRADLVRRGWDFEYVEHQTRVYLYQQIARDMHMAGCTYCGVALAFGAFEGAWPMCTACNDEQRREAKRDAEYGPYLADQLKDAFCERVREML